MTERDPMIDVFIFETQQLLETLEDIMLQAEKSNLMSDDQVNEVFRVMHTIKGSSGMMSYDGLAKISHTVEDLFSQIREKKARSADWGQIFDIVLAAGDMIKADIDRISLDQEPVEDDVELQEKVKHYLGLLDHRVPKADDEQNEAENAEVAATPTAPAAVDLSENESLLPTDDNENAPYYKLKITFDKDCQMENIRAFGVVNDLREYCRKMAHVPEDLMTDAASKQIIDNGFVVYLQSSVNPDIIKEAIDQTIFLEKSTIMQLGEQNEEIPASIRPPKPKPKPAPADKAASKNAPPPETAKQSFISVNVNKVDKLLDLVGEIVTTESMVTKNPEITALKVESFEKASQQLKKLISELQDTVMSVRMLPVSTTFHKMNRIVRDMSKKINKSVDLVILGEQTEVDKNIIDSLSDPLMHLIRNAVDHGLETTADREAIGKPTTGTVTLEARNTGSDVTITVTDDGKGLDRNKLIEKAQLNGITTKSAEEISDKEAFGFIFMPGFSTKEKVTEFSGRGVGMDVVRRNIEKVGGVVSIDSTLGKGTSIQIKIPLTLAIIEGMKLEVGDLVFIIPILSIQESFKPSADDIFLDPDGNEMIMLRGECYSVMRLYQIFDIEPKTTKPEEGILIRITTDTDTYCIMADKLLGEQQAVVKPLPTYIQRHNHNMHGLAGCTILGDGSISLIVDVNSLVIHK